MVKGFNSFKNWFKGFEDQYVIIGGTACDILLEEAGQSFRATKDLDLVLLIEALTPDFVEHFWDYVKHAEYEHRNKSTGDVQFYRFTKPKDPSFITMIELFSRKPEDVFLTEDANLTPLPVDDEISSLSAILLDETYYSFLREGKVVIDGVSVLDETHLIPFKAKAYLDNVERNMDGQHVDSRDIKKHKKDVFKLLLMLPGDQKGITLPKDIKDDMLDFIEAMDNEIVDTKALGAGKLTKENLLSRMKAIYSL